MDELFEFHHAIILLVEPGGETLRVVASRGYENQAIGGRVRDRHRRRRHRRAEAEDAARWATSVSSAPTRRRSGGR